MNLYDFPLLFLIPLLPLIGAAYNGFLGPRLQRRFGHRAVHLPAIVLPWASFVIALAAFVTLARQEAGTAVYQHMWDWIHFGILRADIAFLMDRLSGVMALVVTFVGSLIHIYSVGYMKDDESYWRFFAYLNLFMFAMLVLVLGDNFLLMFVGWEGVGLCSYLLISFWYREKKNAVAGMKAFVVNRVGDLGFSLGLFLLFWGLVVAAPAATMMQAGGQDQMAEGGPPTARPAMGLDARGVLPALSGEGAVEAAGTSVAFRDVERLLEDPARRQALVSQDVMGVSIVTLLCLLLFLGATGKSAQIPLYVWLPDAMAGPTPVSALIHAATMVTAGVYMVARLHFLFALSPAAMTTIALIGALTALLAASIALFQYDIKKVLAYSTVSQLGFMFVAVGVGAYWVAVFHLMTHAFFKACLFLGSGSVILGCHHEQDMRKMGGLRKLMPVTAMTYLVSCAAIAGFPLLSGFFSKEEILWAAFNGSVLIPGGGITIWLMVSLAALFTSFYMFRSYYMTFSGEYRGGGEEHSHGGAQGHHGGLPHESPRPMTFALVVLALLAVIGGYVGLPVFLSLPNVFEPWLAPVFASSKELIETAGRSYSLKWLVLGVATALTFAGFFTARWLYRDASNPLPARMLESQNALVRGVHRTISNKYYVDEVYDAAFVKGSLRLSVLLSWWDRTVIDGLVNLCAKVARAASEIQGFIDRYFVDGLVNLVAASVLRGGHQVRRIQTGQVQTYVYGLAAGAVLLVTMAYFLAW